MYNKVQYLCMRILNNNKKKSSGINLLLTIQLNLAQFLDTLFKIYRRNSGRISLTIVLFQPQSYISYGLLVATTEIYFRLQIGKAF